MASIENMDIFRELKESRELNRKVAKLEREKGGAAKIRSAISETARPDEDNLAYRARLMIFGYADDFLQAAEGGGLEMKLETEEAEQVAFAVGCAYEVNRRNRNLSHEDNIVLLSKQLGCYMALNLCNSSGGKLQIQEVPNIPTQGLSPLLVNGIIFQVSLPGGRTVNTIEVANKVMRSMEFSGDRFGMNQWPIIRLLRDKRG